MPPDRPRHPEYLIVPSLDALEKVRVPETNLRFVVPDAVNPYREALLAGGIAPAEPATAEKKDIAIDLTRLLNEAIPAHRTAGREDWARALEAIRGDIRMTPEKRRILEQEIGDGAIPILMPGKEAQLATTPEQYIKTFAPIWIKDDAPQAQADAYLWEHTQTLIANRDPSLIAGIPERPYLMLIKPTQASEQRTCDKTVDQQKEEVKQINQERQRQGKAPLAPTKPAEYGALQQFATRAIQAEAPTPLTTLQPLDSATYARFIDVPVSSDGFVPSGNFNPDYRKLWFGWDYAGHGYSEGGVRLLVRVEI